MDKLKSEYEQLKEVRDNFIIAIFRYVFNVPLILFFILSIEYLLHKGKV